MFKIKPLSRAVISASFVGATVLSGAVVAQEQNELEEVVVVGSQIKGASITTALPVTVISAGDIDALGLDSGEELLENMAEMGLNYFTEAEAFSGGVNSARGDIGSYNLRNMGVGNTLVLLNGRRLVNSAGYQTELLGGDYVPTLTVNSNLIPTTGLDRVEVLKDGASAIYGADAVAGVVNNVIDSNYEGFSFTTKMTGYDHFDANDVNFSSKFGTKFNDGNSHVTVLVDYYDRDSIKATEDYRWSVGDHRKILPDDSLWKTSTSFRNLYSYQYAQLDQSGTNSFTDSSGEMQILPSDDAKCSGSKALDTGYGTCLVPDTTSDNYYLNPGDYRDFRSDLKRTNIFVTLSHEFGDGLELFSELGYYSSDTLKNVEPAGTSSSAPLAIGADYYYTNNLVQDGENPLAGKKLRLDGLRNPKYGRVIDNEKETTRFLAGLRGSTGEWDWETAILYSKAKANDLTRNRISNTLLTEALADPTEAAFNIFSIDSTNIERALIDVYRNDESELTSFDIKASNNNVFTLPAGPVGLLVGMEYREEAYSDDRDPRLDGTIAFVADNGSAFPFVGDVLGSSPTSDASGNKDTTSVFAELQIPVTESISAQLALRHEDISDAGTTTVGKFAVGWEATDWMLVRGSTQTAFRAPNLVQVNQAQVARVGTTVDAVYQYISGNDKDVRDYDWTMQRYAEGAENLESEESTNSSIGLVIQPPMMDGLVITYDMWKIEKDKTIGLFGRANNTIQDLALLIDHGTSDCGSFAGNPATVREDISEVGTNDLALFAAAGICPVGEAYQILDEYLNLATRTLEGQDIGVSYDFESALGDFGIRYNATFTDTFEQVPTGDFDTIQAAQNSGAIPAYVNLTGFGNLLGIDGNYDEKHSMKLLWSKGSWGGSLTGLKKGDFIQSSLTLADGTEYVVPSMTTMDASLYYKFKVAGNRARIKFAVKNIEDERAPTADRFFGYFADAHQDLGRNYYLSLKVDM
ncbi:MAG: TonB-dependent receptor [Porticoccaceae bacterium]|jgi:iron complex outermembrane receptor protein|nr:TonB-dependent receptor [Porticoccaceae bacterium]